MAVQFDVLAAHADANSQAITGPTRIKGYQVASGGTAGEIRFYDTAANSATGTNRLRVNVTTNQAVIYTLIPGDGIRFTNGAYITLPANAAITVFYG